jgi:hypothetical protein
VDTQVDQETQDTEKVNKAVEAIKNSQHDLARRLLEEVTANTPEAYVYKYEEGDALVIKFWDLGEFITISSSIEIP